MTEFVWTTWLGWALLSIGGVALTVWAIGRRSDEPTCRCGYDMRGISTLECPECGRRATSLYALRIRRRSRKRLLAGILTMAIGAAVWSIEPYRRHGCAGLVPLFALRITAPLFDDHGDRVATAFETRIASGRPTWLIVQGRYTTQSIPGATTAGIPTRWERVLLARQCLLCARRLGAAAPAYDAPARGRLDTLALELTDEELSACAEPIGRLVSTQNEELQRIGMRYLCRLRPRSGWHMDRIGEIAKTSPSFELRWHAIESAEVIAADDRALVEIARIGLRDENADVRVRSIQLVFKVAKDAGAAVEELDALALSEQDPWTADLAAVTAKVIRERAAPNPR